MSLQQQGENLITSGHFAFYFLFSRQFIVHHQLDMLIACFWEFKSRNVLLLSDNSWPGDICKAKLEGR